MEPSGAIFSGNLAYGAGTTGIFVDPVNQDFWPAAASPLLGAADATYAPSLDFNGTLRVGPFDVGAYETEGLLSNPGWSIQEGFKSTGLSVE